MRQKLTYTYLGTDLFIDKLILVLIYKCDGDRLPSIIDDVFSPFLPVAYVSTTDGSIRQDQYMTDMLITKPFLVWISLCLNINISPNLARPRRSH
jgi:hypothetical protein